MSFRTAGKIGDHLSITNGNIIDSATSGATSWFDASDADQIAVHVAAFDPGTAATFTFQWQEADSSGGSGSSNLGSTFVAPLVDGSLDTLYYLDRASMSKRYARLSFTSNEAVQTALTIIKAGNRFSP